MFSPSDSVDILLRAKVSGIEETKQLENIIKGCDVNFKLFNDTIKSLEATIKANTAAVQANTTAFNEVGSAARGAAGGVGQFGGSVRAATTDLRMMDGSFPIRAAGAFLAQLNAIAPVLQTIFFIGGAGVLIKTFDDIIEKVKSWKDAHDPVIQSHKTIVGLLNQEAEQYAKINKMAHQLMLDEFEREHGRAARLQREARDYKDTISLDRAATTRFNDLSTILDPIATSGSKMLPVYSDSNNPDTFVGGVGGINGLSLANRAKAEFANIGVKIDPALQRTLDTVASMTEGGIVTPAQIEAAKGLQQALSVGWEMAQNQLDLDLLKQKGLTEEAGLAGLKESGFYRWKNASKTKFAEGNARWSEREDKQAGTKLDRELAQLVSGSNADERADARIYGKEFHEFAGDLSHRLGLMGMGAAIPFDSAGYESIDAYQARMQHQARMIGLTAGPGMEYASSSAEHNINLQEISTVFDRLIRTAPDLEKAKELQDQKELALKKEGYSYEEKIAELREQERKKYEEMAGQVFDALTARHGGGIGGFLKGQGTIIERQMFVNIADIIREDLKKIHMGDMIGGQTTTDANGNTQYTTLGKILRGTPLGVDPAKLATNANTSATVQNTAATVALTNALAASRASGGFSAATGGFSGVGGFSGINISGLGGSPSSSELAAAGVDSSTVAMLNNVETGPNAGGGFSTIFGGGSGSAFKANYLGAGAALAGGALGAYAGFRRGGTQGDLSGAASLIGGVTSALSMVSKSLNFLGPVGMIAGIGLGFISSLFGNSVEKRENQIQNIISGSWDRLPQQQTKEFDISGYTSNITGPGKAGTVINNYNSNVNLNALDAKSIVDRWSDISSAVQIGVDHNHSVVDSIQQVTTRR